MCAFVFNCVCVSFCPTIYPMSPHEQDITQIPFLNGG